MNRLPILLVLTLLLAVPGPTRAQERKPLPDDVAAIVRGEIVTMAEFRDSLVHRYAGTPDGQQILESLATDIAVENERVRRGITIPDAEIAAYVKKVEAQVFKASAGTKTLDDILSEQGVTREGFMQVSRDFLIRQRMASSDLGTDGEVSQADLGVWVEDLKKRAGVTFGPDLPAGIFARVGDRSIGALEYGRALQKGLPGPRLESALWDVAISRAVRQQLDEEGIELTPEDVDQAITELEREFRSDPRFAGTTLTFEQYVQTVRHMTLEDLKKDPAFLAQVGLGKSVRQHISQAEVKTYWEEHPDRYSEERTFIHLLIRGEENPSPFGRVARSMTDARKKIDALKDRYLTGEAFEKLVADESEARSETVKPESPIAVNRETPMPEALKEAVYTSPIGEVVGPVRTSYGYHLLQVLEVKPAPTFEEIQPQILRDLIREARTRELLTIRKDPQIILRY